MPRTILTEEQEQRLERMLEEHEALERRYPRRKITLLGWIRELTTRLKDRRKARKRRKPCPGCGRKGIVEIVYGLPDLDNPPVDVEFGGCVVVAGISPRWICRECDRRFSDADIGYDRQEPEPASAEDLLENLKTR